MPAKTNQTPTNLVPPSYVFILKEGNFFDQDFLDYSLLLLKTGKPEILKSPPKPANNWFQKWKQRNRT